jgi:hypothetical protein
MQARRRLFTQRDCLCEVAQWHSADLRMPALYKLLAGEHRRTPAIAVIADLQEAATLLVVQRSHGEVIDQQHIGARDALQQPAQTAVGPPPGPGRGNCARGVPILQRRVADFKRSEVEVKFGTALLKHRHKSEH